MVRKFVVCIMGVAQFLLIAAVSSRYGMIAGVAVIAAIFANGVMFNTDTEDDEKED